jgi:hypothetical protein
MLPFEICRNEIQYSLCCWFAPYPVYRCRRNRSDRRRHDSQPRVGQQYGAHIFPFPLRVRSRRPNSASHHSLVLIKDPESHIYRNGIPPLKGQYSLSDHWLVCLPSTRATLNIFFPRIAQSAIDARLDVVEGKQTFIGADGFFTTMHRIGSNRGDIHRCQGRSQGAKQNGLRQADFFGISHRYVQC